LINDSARHALADLFSVPHGGRLTDISGDHLPVGDAVMNATPSADAADALATAICHGHQRALQKRLGDHVIVANLR
jgi:hypothetical protein